MLVVVVFVWSLIWIILEYINATLALSKEHILLDGLKGTYFNGIIIG